jgi:hypothetical protein
MTPLAKSGAEVDMERTTILPYEWFNKSVRVAAYSGEERRPEIDNEGISEPQHVMVRDYVGWLVNADETGLLLVLRGGKSFFLSARAVMSVQPTEE